MIILCGHGHYGETIKNSLEMIAGKQDQIKTVNFTDEMSVTDILEQYNQWITEEEVLIYCDIPGGSPANAAVLAKKMNEKVRVFTGLNLSMMLSIAMGESVEESLLTAKESIKELA